MDQIHYIFAPITKSDKATRTVEGPISGADNLDLDKQIVDTDFLRRAVGPWFRYGNIREQHIPTKAVGKAKTVDVGPDGVPVITAKIVDDAAWAKVEEGIYSGFSVGIKNARIVRDPDAPNGRIIDGDLVEVSIVDHPANPAAKFAICKAAQSGGWVDLQNGVVIEGAATQEKVTMDIPAILPSADKEDKMVEAEVETASADVYKGAVHTHHYLDGDGDVQYGAHTHTRDRARSEFMMDAPYADHKHCKMCGNDDRMCGHGKKAMKDAMSDTTPTETTAVPAAADETKAADNFMGGEPKPDAASPTPASLTMGRSVESLLHDVKSVLEGLAAAGGQGNKPTVTSANGPDAERDPAFTQNVTTPAQSWTGGDLLDLKAAVDAPANKSVIVSILEKILPAMVQQELAKSFGSADLLTKGASPDAVKAAVQSIAESAAAAAVEPVVKRLETVEQMAAPVQGVAHTRDVEKSFAGNREQPAMSFDQAAELVKGLPEADRMKAAIEIIGQAQRQPMSLFRRS